MEWVVGDQGSLDHSLPAGQESLRQKYYPTKLLKPKGSAGSASRGEIIVFGHSLKVAPTDPPRVPIRDLVALMCDMDSTDKGRLNIRNAFWERGFDPQITYRFADGRFDTPVVEWTAIDGAGGLLEFCQNFRSGRFSKKIEAFRNSEKWESLERSVYEVAQAAGRQPATAAASGRGGDPVFRSDAGSSRRSSRGAASSNHPASYGTPSLTARDAPNDAPGASLGGGGRGRSAAAATGSAAAASAGLPRSGGSVGSVGSVGSGSSPSLGSGSSPSSPRGSSGDAYVGRKVLRQDADGNYYNGVVVNTLVVSTFPFSLSLWRVPRAYSRMVSTVSASSCYMYRTSLRVLLGLLCRARVSKDITRSDMMTVM